jgi:hypothetical protein
MKTEIPPDTIPGNKKTNLINVFPGTCVESKSSESANTAIIVIGTYTSKRKMECPKSGITLKSPRIL